VSDGRVLHATRSHPRRTVLAAALIAAALDLSFAFLFYGHQGASPERILRGIAAGVLGREAAAGGGPWVAGLGALLHFGIATCAAFIYYTIAQRWRWLTRRWALGGAAFGIAMYAGMHFVVIPLSRLPFHVQSLPNMAGELCSHIFLFGIVIACGVARAGGSSAAAV